MKSQVPPPLRRSARPGAPFEDAAEPKGQCQESASAPLVPNSRVPVGHRFNPYRLFNGIFIPEGVARYRGISLGAKIVYGRLCRYAGEDGDAHPSVAVLALEVGIGQTQVRQYMRELEQSRFITSETRLDNDGRQTSNQYFFLWHEAFEGSLGEARKKPALGVRKTEPPTLRISEPGRVRKTEPKENHHQESHYEEGQAKQQRPPAAASLIEKPDIDHSRSSPGEKNGGHPTGSSNGSERLVASSATATGVGCLKELSDLLTRNRVRFKTAEVEALVSIGNNMGLSSNGIMRFIDDRLRHKRAQNDPVYSIKLLLNAMTGVDLSKWIREHEFDSSCFIRQGAAESSKRFPEAEIKTHFRRWAGQLRACGYDEIAAEIDLLGTHLEPESDLELTERCLCALEERLINCAQARLGKERLDEFRESAEAQFAPRRGKMTFEQIAALKKTAIEKLILERAGLPRLSLAFFDR